jgi:hypothetical protein
MSEPLDLDAIDAAIIEVMGKVTVLGALGPQDEFSMMSRVERAMRLARREIRRLTVLTDQRNGAESIAFGLRAQVEAVRALHKVAISVCSGCGFNPPCPTIRVLDGEGK